MTVKDLVKIQKDIVKEISNRRKNNRNEFIRSSEAKEFKKEIVKLQKEYDAIPSELYVRDIVVKVYVEPSNYCYENIIKMLEEGVGHLSVFNFKIEDETVPEVLKNNIVDQISKTDADFFIEDGCVSTQWANFYRNFYEAFDKIEQLIDEYEDFDFESIIKQIGE